MQLGLPVVALMLAAGDDLDVRASTEVAAYSDTNHVEVLTPSVAAHVDDPTRGWAVDGRYLLDVISAASVDIISTASQHWTEVRQAGDLRAAYKPGDYGVALNGGVSNEPDYRSLALGGTVTGDFDEKNVTLLAGYGYAHDTIGRTGTPFSIFSRDLAKHSFTASASFLIDRRTVLSLIGDGGVELGDSSKPYRYIPLFAPEVAPHVAAGATLAEVTELRAPGRVLEQRPLVRDRIGITARIAHRWHHETGRLEARLYDDSWAIAAFSSDARMLFDVSERVSLGPHLRYYVQHAANFWRLAYVGTATEVPAYRAGDRELGPLMNMTAGGSLKWLIGPRSRIDAWALGFNVDGTYSRYLADLYITHALAALESVTVEAAW